MGSHAGLGGKAGGVPQRRPPLGRDRAPTNSFQRFVRYLSSSISVFQQAMLPIRSQNDPPSRMTPFFSIRWPYGSMMSAAAGLPSYQYAHSSGVMNCFAV